MARAARQQAPGLKQKLVPAPMGGLNAVSSLAAMPENDAVLLENMVGGDMGLRSRLGYYEVGLGLLQGASVLTQDRIRSLVGFNAAIPSADSKLFAMNKYGIYEVAGGATVGLPKIAFPDTTGDAGVGTGTTVVTSAGHFLAYTDEKNGYYLYKSGTWYKVVLDPAAGTYKLIGFDPANAVFCTVWKHRIFLVEKNSANAWFLDLDAIAGTATRLSFAGKFLRGGYLVGLWSWTFDGGAGPDDYLVALSSAGDVVIYQGTDPTIPGAFNLKGVYYIGQPPSGRKVATDTGGDLLLLGSNGAVPLSKLVLGSVQGDTASFPTHKITPLIARLISNYGLYEGWALKLHPVDNLLMISIPEDSSNPGTGQLALSIATKGWSTLAGLPICCMESYQGKLYFGTLDGRICANDGYVDAVTIAAPAVYQNIDFAGITAFSKYGSLRQKRVQFLRCNFTSDGTPPNYAAAARYRFDTSQPAGGVAVSKLAGALWDVAKWDVDVWPSTQDFASEQRVVGSTGIGPEVAIAFSGKAASRVVLIGFDVMYDEGGLL
jgi:hypothetical protein